jgi:uncharacterized membrane protein YfcA
MKKYIAFLPIGIAMMTIGIALAKEHSSGVVVMIFGMVLILVFIILLMRTVGKVKE